MKNIKFSEIAKMPYSGNAIIRSDFPGFKEDYLVIHSLIRKYKPKTIMEIGTSSGLGTKVICNAMGIKRFGRNRKDIKAYSIDVPVGTDSKIIYPHGEDGHPKEPGIYCKVPFTQIFGNSYDFDFSPYYPIEGWFIDGKHDYKYAKNDTSLALKSNPIVIIWHDADIEEVGKAIIDEMETHMEYDLFRVVGTRIAYAIKSNCEITNEGECEKTQTADFYEVLSSFLRLKKCK
jgi:hypothetical protein